jgi:hypothetical protein
METLSLPFLDNSSFFLLLSFFCGRRKYRWTLTVYFARQLKSSAWITWRMKWVLFEKFHQIWLFLDIIANQFAGSTSDLTNNWGKLWCNDFILMSKREKTQGQRMALVVVSCWCWNMLIYSLYNVVINIWHQRKMQDMVLACHLHSDAATMHFKCIWMTNC